MKQEYDFSRAERGKFRRASGPLKLPAGRKPTTKRGIGMNDDVSISDAGLLAALEEQLGKESGEVITRRDMAVVVELPLKKRGIRELDASSTP